MVEQTKMENRQKEKIQFVDLLCIQQKKMRKQSNKKENHTTQEGIENSIPIPFLLFCFLLFYYFLPFLLVKVLPLCFFFWLFFNSL